METKANYVLIGAFTLAISIFGLLFALSEFIVAWGIAFIYSRRANSEFDAMASELIRDAEKIGGRK